MYYLPASFFGGIRILRSNDLADGVYYEVLLEDKIEEMLNKALNKWTKIIVDEHGKLNETIDVKEDYLNKLPVLSTQSMTQFNERTRRNSPVETTIEPRYLSNNFEEADDYMEY